MEALLGVLQLLGIVVLLGGIMAQIQKLWRLFLKKNDVQSKVNDNYNALNKQVLLEFSKTHPIPLFLMITGVLCAGISFAVISQTLMIGIANWSMLRSSYATEKLFLELNGELKEMEFVTYEFSVLSGTELLFVLENDVSVDFRYSITDEEGRMYFSGTCDKLCTGANTSFVLDRNGYREVTSYKLSMQAFRGSGVYRITLRER